MRREGLPSPEHLLPHRGTMVLLDAIIQWDESAIQCTASSHLSAANPLRDKGRLSVYAGIEYAAQAMAAHVRLCQEQSLQRPDQSLQRQEQSLQPARGFLAQASKLRATVATLDQRSAPLRIDAWPLARNPGHSLYQFQIHAEDCCLLEGRLTAIIDTNATAQ